MTTPRVLMFFYAKERPEYLDVPKKRLKYGGNIDLISYFILITLKLILN